MKKKSMWFISLCVLCFLVLYACTEETAGDFSDATPSQQELTWQEHFDLGTRYLSEGNYEEAIIAFTAAIKIDPKQVPAYVGRGNAYVLSGETEENLAAAKTDYEKAIELDETSADAYLGLADVYIRQGEFEKALEILQQGLEKTSGNQRITDKITEMGELAPQENSLWVLTYRAAYKSDGSSTLFYEFEYDEYGYVTRGSTINPTDSGAPPSQEYQYEYLDGNTIEPGSSGRACICRYYVENPLSGEYELEYTTTATMNQGIPDHGYIAPSGVCVDPLMSEFSRQKVKETGQLPSGYGLGEHYALYVFDEYGNPVEIFTYAPDGMLTGTCTLEWARINPLPLP